ncbi:hypothetical protein N7931_03095 [Catenovulum sp. 2E275]|uniref:hypothetical protein n=1 Tax=Catenovulum sp. 2E275 TaxID=2980497 RepID=UPI0021D24A8D|nr:hypothetical protein [Catenovulum sp. 2E275]MCU4674610.1 hypothetical protein [Catenovulum sp. 2E275]
MLTIKKVLPAFLGVSVALFVSFASFAGTENTVEIKKAAESNIQVTTESEIKKLVAEFNAETVKTLVASIDVSDAVKANEKLQPAKKLTLIAE